MKKFFLLFTVLSMLAGFVYSQACSPASPVSMPFVKDGAGQFCFEATCIAAPINSWNMTQLTINGVDFTNRWADCSALPAAIDGKYYIVYNGAYSWSHFEANGVCCGGSATTPPTAEPTATPTQPPTAEPTPYVTPFNSPPPSYYIYVSAVGSGPLYPLISYSGSYAGQNNAPFNLGPSSSPVTVTFEVLETSLTENGNSMEFANWSIEGVDQPQGQVTVTVTSDNPTTIPDVVAEYVQSTVTAAPTPVATPTDVPAEYIPYLPTADQVAFVPSQATGEMHADITFPCPAFRIADPGSIAKAAGINPDGTTYMSNITVGTKIEAYTGVCPAVLATIRITYAISYGDTTYFGFRVNYNGIENLVKEITITSPTPEPTAAPTPVPNEPVIYSLDPTSGKVGDSVTINGSGFSQSMNTIIFSMGTGSGETGSKIAAASQDGKTLRFSVPSTMCPFCRQSDPPCAAPCLTLGYLTTNQLCNVYVETSGLTSNKAEFLVIPPVTAEPTSEPTEAPTAGPTQPPTTGPTTTPSPTPNVTPAGGTVTPTPTPTPTPAGTATGGTVPPPTVQPTAAPTPVPTPAPGESPTPTPLQPVSDPAPGMVWFGTAADSLYLVVSSSSSFATTVGVCTAIPGGTQNLGAYGFDISYDPARIAVDTSIGTSGVEPLPDGFVSAVNPGTSGLLKIAGFDATGKGPFYSASILRINWKSAGPTGQTSIGLIVTALTDTSGTNIGTSPIPRSGFGARIDVY